MENKEDILDALEEFERKSTNQNENVPPILDDYLLSIARTGETLFPWCKMKTLFMKKLNAVVTDFEQNVPMDSAEVLPNVENVCFNEMTERLRSAIAKFNGIPFTIQRLCELVTDPHKHYKKTDKFLRGIEKNVMVVSTVDPHGTKIVSEQKPMVNGIDGANGYDAKTPEKFSMTTISPTPVNSPVTSGQRWYTSLSGAGDSVSSHNTWQQQERELPLATSVVPETVECSTDESAVATASVENGKDVDDGDDSLDKDSSEAEVIPSTETVASTSTEATVASTETTVASTSTEATVASSETTEASSETTEASTETAEASTETTEASLEATEASTEASEACSDDVSDNDTTTNTEACEEDSHLDVTLESDDSFADTSLDSVDAAQLDVTTCTSPDSSDAVEAPSCGVSRDTSEVDADTSECTTAKRQRRDSGGFDTPVTEERVENQTTPDTPEDSNSPTHAAVDAVAPPDSSNVVDTPTTLPEKSPEHEACAENAVVSDSVTHDNVAEVEHSNSSASSQSSEDGSEVVDASPSQSDGSSDVTDSSCAQIESSSVESSTAGGDSCDDVSSSHHEPMDTD